MYFNSAIHLYSTDKISSGPSCEMEPFCISWFLCVEQWVLMGIFWHLKGSHRSLKNWNLKIWIPGLESPVLFVEFLESPGIWTYRSIFLIISIQEFSRYTSSEIWVYLCSSWNLRYPDVYEPWSMFDMYWRQYLKSMIPACGNTSLFYRSGWLHRLPWC